MRAQESVKLFTNAVAGTVLFTLQGGRYAVWFAGTGSGTVDISGLAPDGATYTAVGVTQITATAGYQVVDLPPGQYEAVVASFTANYLAITRIPGE